MDGDFVIDLFGELARAYLAAVNTRSQVMQISVMFAIGMLIEFITGLLCFCHSRATINI